MNALAGISPWWWVALAILLAAIEMVTITTVVVWAALGAFVTALALWFAPGLGGEAQIGLFAALSIAFFFVGRAVVGRYGQPGGGQAGLNRRAEQLVGREGVVMSFEFHEGKVMIDGVPWPARLDADAATPAAGDRVRVIRRRRHRGLGAADLTRSLRSRRTSRSRSRPPRTRRGPGRCRRGWRPLRPASRTWRACSRAGARPGA